VWGCGCWGWGFGVRAQTPHPPTPNPQSPIPNPHELFIDNNNKFLKIINKNEIIKNYKILNRYFLLFYHNKKIRLEKYVKLIILSKTLE